MRISDNTNFGVVRDSIQRSKGRMEGLQLQSATLRKLNTPSDDPVGTAKVMELRTDKVNNDQFQMNSKMAEAFLTNSDHAVSELAEIVVRAKEIALSQASGASSNDDTRLGVAEEVSQLFQQSVAAANRRVGERYLFGGYRTHTAPVDDQGRYQGDLGQVMVEIAKDVFLTMNVPGAQIFNTEPDASPDVAPAQMRTEGRAPAGALSFQTPEGTLLPENVNLFSELQNLRISLLTGDLAGIQESLERFDQIHSKLIATRAKIGSRIQGIESASQAMERHNITNAQLSSRLEDADMAQVVSDLAKEETVFRSALSSGQKLIQPRLMDFLK